MLVWIGPFWFREKKNRFFDIDDLKSPLQCRIKGDEGHKMQIISSEKMDPILQATVTESWP